MYHLRHIVASGIYVGIPALLVLLQPDLGSAIILIVVWFINVKIFNINNIPIYTDFKKLMMDVRRKRG